MKFAISSCWNSHRHDDGYALLRELADLGFAYVELSHGTRLSLIPGILKAVEEGMIKVTSLHNFCPLPVGIMSAAPNLYEPSAPGRRERILWHHSTMRTVDFAHRVECERIVVHSGHVRFWWRNPERALNEEAYKPHSGANLSQVLSRSLKRLRRARPDYMKRLRESFLQVTEHARQHGVRFGVENREGFSELPLDEDMATFLGTLDSDVFGYWHDTGHARLKERIGILDHRETLETLRPRLIGWHLHDVSAEGRDHCVPGTGEIDWDQTLAFIRPGDTVVLELSPRLSPTEVSAGKEFLEGRIPALRGV